jgi:hypothetical protein
VIQGVFRLFPPSLAKAHGDHICGPHPEEHGKGHAYGHQGHDQRESSQGGFVYSPAHIDAVNHVVEGIDHHADNRRQGEAQKQFPHRLYAKPVRRIILDGLPLFWGGISGFSSDKPVVSFSY